MKHIYDRYKIFMGPINTKFMKRGVLEEMGKMRLSIHKTQTSVDQDTICYMTSFKCVNHKVFRNKILSPKTSLRMPSKSCSWE